MPGIASGMQNISHNDLISESNYVWSTTYYALQA